MFIFEESKIPKKRGPEWAPHLLNTRQAKTSLLNLYIQSTHFKY